MATQDEIDRRSNYSEIPPGWAYHVTNVEALPSSFVDIDSPSHTKKIYIDDECLLVILVNASFERHRLTEMCRQAIDLDDDICNAAAIVLRWR